MSTKMAPLANLLFGQTRGKILSLLYNSPGSSYFVRQVARETSSSIGNAQRELLQLSDAGLVERSILGSQVFYRANENTPVFPELRSLLAKTVGVFQQLTVALAPLSKGIEIAFVYGSVARGEDKPESDIDLMVVGEVELDELLEAVAPVEATLGRAVHPTIYRVADLQRKLLSGNHFLQSLLDTKKVFLIGNEDEFRAIGTSRVVQA